MALISQKSPKPKKTPAPMKQARATASVGGAEPIQSLNVVEEKLRREYNLVGTIGAYLERGLTPVIIAGDLRDMGHAVDRGRGWGICSDPGIAAAANAHFSFLFNADVLIEGYHVTASVADNIEVYTTTPTEAIPIAANNVAGAWRDRKVNAADAPPFFASAAWGALTGTAVSRTNRLDLYRVGQPMPAQPRQIMLTAGSALTFRCTAGMAIVNVAVWGRMWP